MILRFSWCFILFTLLPFKVISQFTSSSAPSTNSSSTTVRGPLGPELASQSRPEEEGNYVAVKIGISLLGVLLLGSIIVSLLFTWRKVAPSKWMNTAYEYSVLSQHDADPEEDIHDYSVNLDSLIDDSSSDEDSTTLTKNVNVNQNTPATIEVNKPDLSAFHPKNQSIRHQSVSSLLEESDEEYTLSPNWKT